MWIIGRNAGFYQFLSKRTIAEGYSVLEDLNLQHGWYCWMRLLSAPGLLGPALLPIRPKDNQNQILKKKKKITYRLFVAHAL